MITIVGGQSTRPNFLILIADDLGIGDISIFGNDSLSTPNIDRIGQEGVVLSHHITAASVCTPSRSAFLTGRYPIRSGMASSGKSRVFLFVASTGGLPSNETTFAQSLKAANYTTALFGKWHLGSDKNTHYPNVHGFDYFYGIPLTNLKDFGNDGQSVILSYFPHFYLVLISTAIVGVSIGYAIGLIQFRANKIISIFLIVMFIFIPSSLIMFQRNIKTLNALLYRNQELIEQPIELNGFTDRIIYESNKFIRQSHKSGQPFLAVVNFLKVHTAHFPSDKFSGKSKFGKYGDCVLELDNAVGQILKVLQELNIENNTFVYFSSDNGAHLEEVNLKGEPEGGSNGIFRGGKGHGAMEGGIRVPSLAMWPSVIPPNRWINVPTMQMDIFPTIHAITEQQLPVNVHIDGKNILPLLQGQMETSPHEFMFHYCGSYLHGIRWIENDKNIWKVYYYTPKYKDGEDKCKFMCMCFQPYIVRHDPPLVYNIGQDPSERNAIDSNSEQYHRVVKMALEAKGKHERNIIPVPSQLTLRNTIWRPWLQPYNI